MMVTKSFLCIALGVLAFACGSSNSKSDRVSNDPLRASDPEIATCLEYLNPQSVQSGTEREVQLDLHNTCSRELSFRWTVDWFDSKGARISFVPDVWNPLSISASGAQRLTLKPMPAEARSWQLRFAP